MSSALLSATHKTITRQRHILSQPFKVARCDPCHKGEIMPSIYDDPDLQQESDFPDQVRFERTGDRVRGRVLTVEKINTRLGPVAKYLLMTDDGQRSLLAGAK